MSRRSARLIWVLPLALSAACSSGGGHLRTAGVTPARTGAIASARPSRATSTVLANPSIDSATPTAGGGGPILVPVGVVSLTFPAWELVLAGTDVYAIGQTRIDRINVVEDRVVASTQLPGCITGASVGGGVLAVLSTTAVGCPAGQVASRITVLDPVSLAVHSYRDIQPAVDLLARSDGIYVSMRSSIVEFTRAALTASRSIAVPASQQSGIPGASIGADPRSQVLWASIPCSCLSEPQVVAISLRTWTILDTTRIGAVLGAEVQGYHDDAWLDYATGNFSAASLLSPNGRVLATIQPLGTNAAKIIVTGRHLWSANAVETDTISCYALNSGTQQGTISLPPPAGSAAFNADSSHVYLVNGDTLVIYRPSAGCA